MFMNRLKLLWTVKLFSCFSYFGLVFLDVSTSMQVSFSIGSYVSGLYWSVNNKQLSISSQPKDQEHNPS